MSQPRLAPLRTRGQVSAIEARLHKIEARLYAPAAQTIAGQVIATVPALATEHEQTIAAAGVTAGMRVLATLAPHADTDENHETLLDVAALAAEPGSGTLTVRMAFAAPTSGAIRINYLAA